MLTLRKHKISRLEEFSDAVFGFALTLLVITAHRMRAALGLTDMEVFDTRALAGHHLISAGVGLFAMLFALIAPREIAFLPPSSFALLGPGHWGFAAWTEKRRRAFVARLAAAGAPSAVQVM